MDADLDNLCAYVYCTADDFLPEEPGNARRRTTDAEMVTLLVAQAITGSTSDRHFPVYAHKNLRHAFPEIPHQAGYHKRRRALTDTRQWLLSVFAEKSPGYYDDLLLIDSTPVEPTRSRETGQALRPRRRGRLRLLSLYFRNSDFTATRVALAETLVERGDADGAIELYFDVIKSQPMGVHFDQTRVALARLLVEVDQSQNASLQEKALAENPEKAEAKELLGELRSVSSTPPPTGTGTTNATTATTSA